MIFFLRPKYTSLNSISNLYKTFFGFISFIFFFTSILCVLFFDFLLFDEGSEIFIDFGFSAINDDKNLYASFIFIKFSVFPPLSG